MKEWKKVKLGDILNFRRGHDLPKYNMNDGFIPVAGSNGIIGYHNEATLISPCITVGRSGNTGTPYIYDKCWAHNTVLYIDDFKGNNPYYLYYLLKTIPLSLFSGGSAVPTLNRNHIHPIMIQYCVNKKIQNIIANFLSSLDDKIALNKRINDNLEQQAQALYKSWFVDFEPFREGKFVDSDLGEIPEGWMIKHYTDVVNVLSGGTPKTDVPIYWKGNIPFFSPKDVTNNFYVIKTEKYITETGLKNCNSSLYPANTTCITARGTVGKVVLLGVPMAINQSNYALKYKLKGFDFYSYLLALNVVHLLKNMANGAVFDAITTKDIASIHICDPMEDVKQQFQEILEPIFGKMLELQLENEKLAHLRDALLPKLMSGELKISDFNH